MAGKTVEKPEVSTTGHEWDGIEELNNPLPKWWLYTFYATIVWSIVYWVLMPSWPLISDYTRGLRGHSQRAIVAEQVAAGKAMRMQSGATLADADLETIRNDPDMLTFALANGRAAFGDNCAGCHGTGAAGFKGYPNLNDDDWLWGGGLEDIHLTLLHGINWEQDDDTRIGGMMAFGPDELLSRKDIAMAARHVRVLAGLEPSEGYDAEAGATLFEENCAACHGDEAEGSVDVGAPNLTDAIWLYGADEETIYETIYNGRLGAMPAWVDRLDPITIKSLAVYIHSLGGGQ